MPDPRLFGYGAAEDHPETAELYTWHAWLRAQPQRGERARLRRAASLTDAALTPAFQDLARRLRQAGRLPEAPPPWLLRNLAALALSAAALERHDDAALAQSMGRPAEPGRSAPVSAARFRRLLEAENLEERAQIVRRLLRLAGGDGETRANLLDLARLFFGWTPRLRRQMAYDYYRNAPKETTT